MIHHSPTGTSRVTPTPLDVIVTVSLLYLRRGYLPDLTPASYATAYRAAGDLAGVFTATAKPWSPDGDLVAEDE